MERGVELWSLLCAQLVVDDASGFTGARAEPSRRKPRQRDTLPNHSRATDRARFERQRARTPIDAQSAEVAVRIERAHAVTIRFVGVVVSVREAARGELVEWVAEGAARQAREFGEVAVAAQEDDARRARLGDDLE